MIKSWKYKKMADRWCSLVVPVFFVILVYLVAGCGKKAFPVAPASMIPEPPKKIEAVIDKGEIKVSWLLSDTENVSAVNLYRSRIPKTRFCATCPYTFEPVGSVPVTEKIYREKAVSGYHYAFKIEIEGVDGETSTSRIVTVETP